jgi:hypothetical protein
MARARDSPTAGSPGTRRPSSSCSRFPRLPLETGPETGRKLGLTLRLTCRMRRRGSQGHGRQGGRCDPRVRGGSRSADLATGPEAGRCHAGRFPSSGDSWNAGRDLPGLRFDIGKIADRVDLLSPFLTPALSGTLCPGAAPLLSASCALRCRFDESRSAVVGELSPAQTMLISSPSSRSTGWRPFGYHIDAL